MYSRVLVANLSAPELRYLAAGLAQRHLLSTYVSRYANQGRVWERLLQRLPLAGSLYKRSLGLRWMPEGLNPSHIAEAGVTEDFAAAVLARMGRPGSAPIRMAYSLYESATVAIGRKAAALVRDADCVVAGVGMALPSFQVSASRKIPRVLNYPSAHHRFQRGFFEMQAQRLPEFARLDEPPSASEVAREPQFDEECDLADVILTGSRFARDSFIGQGIPESRLKAIPYGVDVNLFRPRPRHSSGRFRVVYVGRIGMRKGIGYLLRAYRNFRRDDTDLQLVGRIIGDESCLRPYADLFTHVPHVPQAQLPRIYQEADVFVFPSLLEGLGLVALEAMACGCPVIVSENGPGDVVRDGVDGFVIPAADSQAIEAALLRLYRDPGLRQSMAQSARQQAERYTWTRYINLAMETVLGARTGGQLHA